jgi:hypothetical protein
MCFLFLFRLNRGALSSDKIASINLFTSSRVFHSVTIELSFDKRSLEVLDIFSHPIDDSFAGLFSF